MASVSVLSVVLSTNVARIVNEWDGVNISGLCVSPGNDCNLAENRYSFFISDKRTRPRRPLHCQFDDPDTWL